MMDGRGKGKVSTSKKKQRYQQEMLLKSFIINGNILIYER